MDRQQYTKRRSSGTPLYVTKIPPTKKSNIWDTPIESNITMPLCMDHSPKKDLVEIRNRSLSPRSSSNIFSRLAQSAHRSRNKEQDSLAKSLDHLEEMLKCLEEVEKHTTSTEKWYYSIEERLYSAEDQIKQITTLIKENKALHETVQQLTTDLDTTKWELETVHAKIAQMETSNNNPNEIRIDNVDMDLDERLTTTKDSIHALSDED